MTDLLQFLISGLQVGAVYALVALGFTMIYNVSHVVNFAQGEFVMIGALTTASLSLAGMPLALAVLGAVLITAIVGTALYVLAIAPARGADVVSLIIITIGASIFLRGLGSVIFGKSAMRPESFSGDEPVLILGARVLPQVFWVLGGAAVIFVLLALLLSRTLTGRAVLATASDSFAAKLVGINTVFIMFLSFAISAGIGAMAGALVSPITTADYRMGTILALKGFAAAMMGGIGVPAGAVMGGLALGLIEQFTAGYLSSTYKDAVAFLVLLAVIWFLPQGFFGRTEQERV